MSSIQLYPLSDEWEVIKKKLFNLSWKYMGSDGNNQHHHKITFNYINWGEPIV